MEKELSVAAARAGGSIAWNSSGLQIQIVSTFLDEVLVPLVTDR
jgi:hypothetical protein